MPLPKQPPAQPKAAPVHESDDDDDDDGPNVLVADSDEGSDFEKPVKAAPVKASKRMFCLAYHCI